MSTTGRIIYGWTMAFLLTALATAVAYNWFHPVLDPGHWAFSATLIFLSLWLAIGSVAYLKGIYRKRHLFTMMAGVQDAFDVLLSDPSR